MPQFQLAFELPARLGEAGAPEPGRRRGRGAPRRRRAARETAELRERIFDDARAAWRNDPSCRHPIEALYAYPGVFAITRHRIAHILYGLDVPLLPRLVAEDAHRRTGIDINAGATIGREFFIDHGTGVVIGETAVVGDRVTLYQGVTLGAKSFQVDKSTGRLVKGKPRHPIVEDDVTIYASATVLGRDHGRARQHHRRQRLAHAQRAAEFAHLAGRAATGRLHGRRRHLSRMVRGLTRREFNRLAAAAGACAFVPFGASHAQVRFASPPFQLGVASGDPTPDGFVIWTRLAPEPIDTAYLGQTIFEVGWEVAEDSAFSDIVKQGTSLARPHLAHSLHVEVGGLAPGREYFYRFRLGRYESATGRARTCPAGECTTESAALRVRLLRAL